MKWILILIATINPSVNGAGGSSVDVQHVEFLTRQACEDALRQARQLNEVEQNRTATIHVHGFCAARE